MTPAERAAARARCEAATPGPWESVYHHEAKWPRVRLVYAPDQRTILAYVESDKLHPDAELVAHARTDLPAALDEIERLETRGRELEAENRVLAIEIDMAVEQERATECRLMARLAKLEAALRQYGLHEARCLHVRHGSWRSYVSAASTPR